ncbi:MAG: hypothetical protein A6D91_09940 [Bacillaceae bacterium G1]|nr:MAG: hypothetical protein A6D91_09940 [Bacillaceae bacterium G1]
MPFIKPFIASARFYATIGDGTGTGATFAIPATAFVDDEGNAVTAFPTSYAYYNLYINAMLQLSNASTLSASEITIPDGDTLHPATPVVVEIVVN